MTDLYWSLNETPMQKQLRNIKPFPVGVVYYQQRTHGMDSIRRHFQRIKDLGFTALKQVQLKSPNNPEGFRKKVFNEALDTGISPWYYGKGGWEPITQELVDELGINLKVNKANMPAIQEHPKMVDYQTNQVMRKRIAKMQEKPPKPKGMGEPGRNNPWMPERLLPHFAQWLKDQYGNLETLKKAWNCGYITPCPYKSFKEAANELKGTGFDNYGRGTGKLVKDFRRYRDAMRFQASLIVKNYRKTMELYTNWDPYEPERTGGHQIFENQPMNTWDLQGQAKAAAVGGSFYASIHLTHHFFLVDGELTRPVYMQARTVADMFKGGWAATWESTGGPTTWSGYHPNTVNGKTMKQLMLSYMAAGLKGIGFWMWNSRGEGWEVGEYALCDVQGQPSPRAKTAGHLSEVIQEQRFELWEAMDEPTVGVLYSWENEAMLGRLSMGQYRLNTAVYETDWDKQFRQYHSEAKIGISRALMNQNIPFEYVTARDINEGLAARYPVIYLPFTIALKEETMQKLAGYVEQGGRIVADMPLLMIDTYGRLNKQRKGSLFEKVFGFQTDDYYHTFNTDMTYHGDSIYTRYNDLTLTHAQVIDRYDNGIPAIVSSNYGDGSTTVFNFEAGRSVFEPGNRDMEQRVVYYTLDDIRPPFDVDETANTMVFRRSAPKADHYFLLNDGPEETVRITTGEISYSKATDLLTKENLAFKDRTLEVKVPAHSGRWIRCIKAE